MNERPNLLLTMSAAVYLIVAIPLLFAPEETLALAGAEVTPLASTLVQVLAAALFGFFMLAWMNRHSRVGGVFGRPIVLANFSLTAITALTLGRLLATGARSWALLLALATAAALAAAFGAKLFLAPRGPAGANE